VGFSDAQLNETFSIAQPLLDNDRSNALIADLLQRTRDLLTSTNSANPRFQVRGFQIATRLIQQFSPIPSEGIRLGSERSLCDRFRTSRPTFRQALRILDDFGTLQVQRGRGGGLPASRRPTS
jgi:hypothetical protein